MGFVFGICEFSVRVGVCVEETEDEHFDGYGEGTEAVFDVCGCPVLSGFDYTKVC